MLSAVVTGRSSPRSKGTQTRASKLDLHSDPLVGQYARTPIGTWWADVPVAGLSYAVRLIARGSKPTKEQLDRFEALVQRLPSLIEQAHLGEPPADDGWGNSPPPFNIHSARISSIGMTDDGGFIVIFDTAEDTEYSLNPLFEISPDLELISATWAT